MRSFARYLVWIVALAIAAPVLRGQGASSAFGSGISTRDLSVEEMTYRSPTIVLGTVSIEAGSPPQLPNLSLRKITISPIEILRGKPNDGDNVVIYQRPNTVTAAQGSVVLWFIAEANEAGLSAPIGFRSGHFDLTINGATGRRMVENLSGNEALWATHLWTSRVSRNKVKAKLPSTYSPSEVEALLRIGDSPCPPAPVPYDLIRAFVLAKLDAMR